VSLTIYNITFLAENKFYKLVCIKSHKARPQILKLWKLHATNFTLL